MNTFDTYLHTIIMSGTAEARWQGSATVEAQHLLLAIADQEGTVSQRILAGAGLAGLDREAILAALEREFDHSLAAFGMTRPAFTVPPSGTTSTTMGATGKLALERGFASVTRKKDLRPAHVLLGVLRAEVGTVPRALALSGVDRAELITRILAEESA